MRERSLRGAAVFLFLLLCLATLDVAAARAEDPAPAPPPGDQASAPAPAATVNSAIAERLLQANDYLEKGRADDALSIVNDLLRARKLKPADLAQIHRFRGYILVAKSDTTGAATEFETALATAAIDESARRAMMYSLAQIYTQNGKYDRARDLIDRWFQSVTDAKPEAYFLKAMILVQQEAYRDALEPARIAIQKSPQPRESWLQLLAAIEFQLQDYAALADTLRQLVAVAPGTKRYWVQLATIENSMGKDDGALATLGVAHIAGILSDDREYRQKARMCFVQNLPYCCASTLETGMEAGIVKRDAESYQLLANCYIAAREIDRAREPLARAGELASDAKSYLLLGQLELQKDRFDAARVALEKARPKATAAERSSIELLIGIAQLGANRFDDAEKSFRLAEADEKTREAAESYLKHLEQKRAMQGLGDPASAGGEESGVPVSETSQKSTPASM